MRREVKAGLLLTYVRAQFSAPMTCDAPLMHLVRGEVLETGGYRVARLMCGHGLAARRNAQWMTFKVAKVELPDDVIL